MKNTVILIHKIRDDIKSFIDEFPECYIYIDQKVEIQNPRLINIEHTSRNTKNVIGNGIRHIHKDFPNSNIILVNEAATIEDIKLLANETIENNQIVIAKSDAGCDVSRKKTVGIKLITKLFNMVHKQKANNIMSNVQGISSEVTQYFLKLKGDTCSLLINERFIIKDHSLEYKYIDIKSDVQTDAPNTIYGYIKCIAIICYVFIKFMISSISAFLIDNSLAFVGYAIWSPYISNYLSSLNIGFLEAISSVEVISIVIARIISSIYNYIFNKKVVFATGKNVAKLSTACKYFTLVLIILAFNTIIVKSTMLFLGIPFQLAKIMADIILYFVSFTVQRDFVFKKRNN